MTRQLKLEKECCNTPYLQINNNDLSYEIQVQDICYLHNLLTYINKPQTVITRKPPEIVLQILPIQKFLNKL